MLKKYKLKAHKNSSKNKQNPHKLHTLLNSKYKIKAINMNPSQNCNVFMK